MNTNKKFGTKFYHINNLLKDSFCVYISQIFIYIANNSRRSKIRFYENKGSNGVNICVCKHMASMEPTGNFVF